MRTYEPRQGRKAATAVCSASAVVTLALSPRPRANGPGAVDKKRPWFTAKAQRTKSFSFSALSGPRRLTFPRCIRFGLRGGERVRPASLALMAQGIANCRLPIARGRLTIEDSERTRDDGRGDSSVAIVNRKSKMPYQVIARKYRPQRFSDVVGQEHVTQTLANAISQKRIAHAYLFCGPRGTGKTTIARIFAKCLNCTGGPKVDFEDNDPRCLEITDGRALDVLEIDGASNNGVEQVRELRETCKYAPASSKFKIYIIDEVHMLTTAAFNALLKTLEEPPAHVKFMFATTDPEKVLPTILSRCQRFDL